MATRANRAATGATKQGGRHPRTNRSSGQYDPRQRLDAEANQEAFRKGRKETVARRHNLTAGVRTDPHALGVPEGEDYTPPRRRAPGTPPAESTGSEAHPRRVFNVVSPAIKPHGKHPGELAARYTVEGEHQSPPLHWSGAERTAEEFVLICEDLDSGLAEPPVHWLVYRIPASVRELPEAISDGESVRSVLGAPLQGRNSFGKLGYSAPSLTPFDPWHHYRFRIFALEAPLRNLRPGMTKTEIMDAMKGHILEATELVCRYRRTDYIGSA